MTTDMPVIKSIPNIVPNDAATPLPPLNFKNIEKIHIVHKYKIVTKLPVKTVLYTNYPLKMISMQQKQQS